jgi:putative redox protein
MKARIKLVEGVTLMAESDSGHGMVIDGAPDIGGRNLGPRPMEVVLMGLGGCSAMDVLSILSKARQKVTDCNIELTAERAESPPKVFTKIHVRYAVTGHGLEDKHVARAVKLSMEKYCSVTAMLAKTAAITHDYEVIEAS